MGQTLSKVIQFSLQFYIYFLNISNSSKKLFNTCTGKFEGKLLSIHLLILCISANHLICALQYYACQLFFQPILLWCIIKNCCFALFAFEHFFQHSKTIYNTRRRSHTCFLGATTRRVFGISTNSTESPKSNKTHQPAILTNCTANDT